MRSRQRFTFLALAIGIAAPAAATGPTNAERAAGEKAAGDAPGDENAARNHYQRGIARYDDGEFALALVEFERAYALRPSYRLLYNIGQVYYQLHRYARARHAFERYLTLGWAEIPRDRRVQVQLDLAALRLRTAHAYVRVNVRGAEISVNDEEIGVSPLSAWHLVDAGTRQISVSKPGFSTWRRTISVTGGELLKLEASIIDLSGKPTVAAPSNTQATIAWVSAGVLAAGAVGTGVATVLASDRLEEMRKEETSRSELDDQRSLVNRLALTTDILGGTAVAAGGVALYFTLRGPSRPMTQERNVTFSVSPAGARANLEF